MPLTRIPIDESWGPASEDRRQDWRLAIDALIAEHTFAVPSAAATLRISLDEHHLVLTWVDGPAAERRIEVPRATLRQHLDEYLGICRRMQTFDGGAALEGLEVLDWAKKLAHDDAARMLQRLCREVRPDHATSRRLFTLIVTILVDTSQLPVVHVHELLRRSDGAR